MRSKRARLETLVKRAKAGCVWVKLRDEEKRMLDGERGYGTQRAMELLVALGTTFEADEMLPVTRTHVALSGQEGDTYWCELLVDGGAYCKVPPTTNPAWAVEELGGVSDVTDAERELAWRTFDVYRRIGAKLTYCCTPELAGNVPAYGEHVAFSESSATPYVNAVLGARSNRESSVSALACAVTGVTPRYGLHFAENRKGTMLVDVEADLNEAYDWGMMGWYVGRFVGSHTPVFRLRDFSRRPTPEELLYLGAELNTSGAVPMYHILGTTPEAPDMRAAFGGVAPAAELVVKNEHLAEQQELLSEKGGRINSVMLGCPHYTYDQLIDLAGRVEGKKVHPDVSFWVLTSWDAIELARRSGHIGAIEAFGARLVPDTCIDEPCWKTFEGGTGVTDSPKNMYYRKRRGQTFAIRRLSECIDAAVRGEVS